LPSGFQAYDETYDKAYEDAMERIEGQISDEKELAMQVIYWITCAKTPLTTSQLEVALAIERESFEFDEDNICPVEDMVSVCAGLVTIDEESGIIRLVHYTAQQYFKRTQGKWFPQIETNMAAICCTYLSFEQFGSGIWLEDKQLQQREEDNVLYSYAAHNWGLHAREDSTLIPEVATFLDKQDQVEAASQSQLYGVITQIAIVRLHQPRKMTGLHLAAYFGLEKAVQFLVGRQSPDAKDSNERTPLSYAAENGHEAVVKLLLATDGVDPSSKLTGLRVTSLYFAAGKGHEAIVRLLLAQEGVDPESMDSYGQSVLSLAAENGHLPIVKLLLDIDGVDPNRKGGRRGETPLSFAISNGHVPVIKLLLARCAKDGINTDIQDGLGGYTPLHSAAQRGDDEVVRLLLAQKGVNVNNLSMQTYTTPIVDAAEGGHEAVVELLLAHENIVPDFQDSPFKATALQRAAENGHEGVVRLLLAHKGVNPDVYGRGESALSLAARKGHMGIVQQLQDHKSINKA
jgi:ankyrin repeat protein